MRGAARWAVPAFAAVVAGACSGDQAEGPTAEALDSAGVRIVTYELKDVQIPTYRVAAEHDLEIGVRDGAPEYSFSRIPGLAVTRDGSFVVSDALAQELRVYDATGTYVRTIGQRGEGPGEFASAPAIVGLAGDTVFVFDRRSRRVTSFLVSGDLIEMTTLRSDDIGRPVFVIRLDDGTYLSQSPWINPSGESGPQDMRLDLDSIAIEHLDPTGMLIDTVRVMADRGMARAVQVRASGVFATQQAPAPYSARAFVRSDGRRTILGRSDAFELALLGQAGDAPTLLRVRGVAHPATADQIRAHQEAAIREELGDGELNPTTRMLNLGFLPDRLPSFASIVIADSGDIWVALTEYDGSEGYDWLVFSPAGELLGTVHTPPDTRLLAIHDDFVVGVVLDEFDVPYVRRHALLASPEGGT